MTNKEYMKIFRVWRELTKVIHTELKARNKFKLAEKLDTVQGNIVDYNLGHRLDKEE